MEIEDIGYVDDIRQRMGLKVGDTSLDGQIINIDPFERVRMIAGWSLGSGSWADTFRSWCESQGLEIRPIEE